MSHTPGPWSIAQLGDVVKIADGDGIRNCAIIDAKQRLVGAAALGWPESTAKANARLIAAAPELLVALRDICNALVRYQYAQRDSIRPFYEAGVSALTKVQSRK